MMRSRGVRTFGQGRSGLRRGIDAFLKRIFGRNMKGSGEGRNDDGMSPPRLTGLAALRNFARELDCGPWACLE